MIDQNSRSNIMRDSVGSASLLNYKLDPKLVEISREFNEAIWEIRACPGCGKQRYLNNAYFCVNPNCNED